LITLANYRYLTLSPQFNRAAADKEDTTQCTGKISFIQPTNCHGHFILNHTEVKTAIFSFKEPLLASGHFVQVSHYELPSTLLDLNESHCDHYLIH